MLQPRLLPLIQIEPFPRICFVLHMLLGYSTALSAQILGVEESHVLVLFQMAARQLQQTVAGNRIPL
jgi:DNA-directed RNA polymerase specialized sigma24 family protein